MHEVIPGSFIPQKDDLERRGELPGECFTATGNTRAGLA